MRRIWATLLLSVIALTAAIPLVFADAESRLPACCRRDGKHQCAMMSMQPQQDAPTGPTFRAVRMKCPYCPSSSAASPYPGVAELEASPAIFANLASHPAVHAQVEARYRISFTRTCQKRGPPVRIS